MFGGFLHRCTVVVIDGQSANDAVVSPLQQFYYSVFYLASVVLRNNGFATQLSQLDNGAVTIFAYQYDIGAVNDDFLVVCTLADENLIRLVGLLWSPLYSTLDTFAGGDNFVKGSIVDFRLTKHLDGAVLIGSFGLQTNRNFMLRIILVGPLFIEREEGGNAVYKPRITITTLVPYLFQSAARDAIPVAYKRLSALQVVIACPNGRSR